MNASDLIGYAYDADTHCVECTQRAYTAGTLTREQPDIAPDNDENDLPYDLDDGEGNPVAPIFVCTAGADTDRCGDCGAALIE